MKYLKRIITLMFCMLLLGGTIVHASCKDTSWGYRNYSGLSYSGDRLKETSGNIYCYPKEGSTVYATVQKMSNLSKSYSKKVTLKKGTKYTIVNSAGSNCYVRLKFNAIAIDSTINSGVWSPDASRDYTIVGR